MGTDNTKPKAGRKIFGIIRELKDEEMLGVTELASRLGMAKSTTHYHLKLLQEEGYVVKSDSKYRLSLRFLRLGEITRDRVPIYESGVQQVNKLANQTSELAILAVEEQGMGVYLYKSGGEAAVDIDAPIGRFAYLHNRAYGKAILAHLPESRVTEILDKHGLPRTSPHTITDRTALFEELSEIQSQGFATNLEESIEGIHGIAVPVLDNDGSVLGGMSLAGPSKRLNPEKMTGAYAEQLLEARNVVELNVQHREF